MDFDDYVRQMRQQQEQPEVTCGRCQNTGPWNRKWNMGGNAFVLCEQCNPMLYKLIGDWLKLGWTDMPAKEYTPDVPAAD